MYKIIFYKMNIEKKIKIYNKFIVYNTYKILVLSSRNLKAYINV